MPAILPGEKKLAQKLAVSALARGATIEQAAERAQVHARTISSWKADPVFAARVEEEQERLAEHEPEAVAILRQALYAKRSDPWDWPSRLRAARDLLDQVPDESPITQPVTVELVFDADFLERFEKMRQARDEESRRRYEAWGEGRLRD